MENRVVFQKGQTESENQNFCRVTLNDVMDYFSGNFAVGCTKKDSQNTIWRLVV